MENKILFLFLDFGNKNITDLQMKNIKLYKSVFLNSLSIIFKIQFYRNKLEDVGSYRLFKSSS